MAWCDVIVSTRVDANGNHQLKNHRKGGLLVGGGEAPGIKLITKAHG